ncbi:pyruvate dehydrogenase (acetyl-transferring) E1 component subunit alpha, partial [Candidatus Micrarchaeota archaeon]|nr:pyruvate dehydrogenase (acetyl-transferring) E1 component subunit alpha [Candidatus Micrarchaeota archaeon]
WMGNEEGCKIPKDVNNFPVAIPIASLIIHGVGLSIAAKIKNKKLASLVYFGDGATSEGEFHEGLNFAGVFKAPVVFVCQNNQYAISVSREKQTASQTIAQKAFAYGLDGIQVDGMDVLAVYKATKDALEKAKNDGTPTLIECVTYRFGPHTTADDPTKYRSDEEVAKWREKDPLKRFRIYLEKKGIWSKEYEEKVHAEAKALVEKAVQEAEATQPPAPDEMFKYTYSEQIPELYEQLEELKNILKEKPKE